MNSVSPRLFRDHGHSDSGRTRFRRARHQGELQRGDCQPAVRAPLFRGQERRRAASRDEEAARKRSSISRLSAWWRTRCTKGRAKACGGRSSFRTGARTAPRSMCAPGWAPRPTYAALRNEVKKLDASMPVYEMKTLAAQLDQTLLTERLIALLSAGFGLLATLLASDRTLRRDGVRGGPAHEGNGPADGAGSAARFGDLARHERGPAAAVDRFGDRHSGGDRPGAVRVEAALRRQGERSMDRRRHAWSC